jgi:hypothetical protein
MVFTAIAAVATVVASVGVAAAGVVGVGLAAGSLGAMMVGGAVIGAVVGGVSAAIKGENIFKGILKGGLVGLAAGGALGLAAGAISGAGLGGAEAGLGTMAGTGAAPEAAVAGMTGVGADGGAISMEAGGGVAGGGGGAVAPTTSAGKLTGFWGGLSGSDKALLLSSGAKAVSAMAGPEPVDEAALQERRYQLEAEAKKITGIGDTDKFRMEIDWNKFDTPDAPTQYNDTSLAGLTPNLYGTTGTSDKNEYRVNRPPVPRAKAPNAQIPGAGQQSMLQQGQQAA